MRVLRRRPRYRRAILGFLEMATEVAWATWELPGVLSLSSIQYEGSTERQGSLARLAAFGLCHSSSYRSFDVRLSAGLAPRSGFSLSQGSHCLKAGRLSYLAVQRGFPHDIVHGSVPRPSGFARYRVRDLACWRCAHDRACRLCLYFRRSPKLPVPYRSPTRSHVLIACALPHTLSKLASMPTVTVLILDDRAASIAIHEAPLNADACPSSPCLQAS
ncbi:hypothetical protein OBBRIDRAFT_292851 [Obba rivulosa]|uniref:Uncharacterized protein n=1 Tax=Obba rivulosa TaxID=1052685 RepID=A0A8E2DQ31_9APHY|nr:hypothetical protein OBBRIDRAFT_292851 [Obba rivulosa]